MQKLGAVLCAHVEVECHAVEMLLRDEFGGFGDSAGLGRYIAQLSSEANDYSAVRAVVVDHQQLLSRMCCARRIRIVGTRRRHTVRGGHGAFPQSGLWWSPVMNRSARAAFF